MFRFGLSVVDERQQIQLVSVRTRVRSLALLSGLRIWCCRELWFRLQMCLDPRLLWLWCRPDWTPSLGLSICHVCGPQKPKKKKKKKNSGFWNHLNKVSYVGWCVCVRVFMLQSTGVCLGVSMCICVCVFVFVEVCVCVCMCLCVVCAVEVCVVFLWVCLCMCLCLSPCVFICVYVYIHVSWRVCIRVSVCL